MLIPRGKLGKTPRRNKVWGVLAVGPALACAAVPVSDADSASIFGIDDEPSLADRAPADNDNQRADDLLARAEENIAAFNEADPETVDPQLLVHAADCFIEAGFWGKATFVLGVLQSKFPAVEHAHDHAEVRKRTVTAMLDRQAASKSLWGRRCVKHIHAQWLPASPTAEVIAAADCLAKAAYGAAALELYRDIAAREDLSDQQKADNDKRLANLEATLERAAKDRDAG